ncbi:PREDICTED: sorting nexin-25 isoform X2 [Nicrophorus vespilloides]|uniref:Sorting nexin-25 isoform X2 n=1 Tax=Nicrophorus vespilloides TaxID=110193 RepID=A0ABM1M5I9_NICVS|nr:PREDICTED: sorting nexin-25 isoform X2 [Nicrophorus vespilloides]
MHLQKAQLIGLSFLIACLGLMLVSETCLAIILATLLTAISVVLGIWFVIWVHILLSLNHKTGSHIEHVQKEMNLFRSKLMYDGGSTTKSNQDHLPVILGRTIDNVLQQLIDNFIRDFIAFYLNQYTYGISKLSDNIKEDMWGAIQNLHDRLSRMDHVTLIACDMITKIEMHFERIREAKTLVAESNHQPLFKVSPFLMSQDHELNYLRQISELFIMFLLPRSYSLPPAKYFLREILACRVLYTLVNNITDPDFFNQYVIVYIESQKVANLMHRKTFEYANTFEEFLKIIQKTDDLEILKRFRYDIVTKIMQATTLQNMKRAKGIDPDNDKSGINKSEINEAKKLKRYLDQLQSAKKECEKRLMDLGWDAGVQHHILPLNSILDHILGRRYLANFLETMASQGLVGYWTAVEDLRVAHRKNWHQVGAEIFYTFIRNPQAEIKVDKTTRKRMEAFLLGDKGPEVFYEVQQQVIKLLEDKYYQPFINSRYYNEMIAAIDCDEGVTEVDSKGSSEDRQNSADLENNLHVGEHSNYARRKLNQLQEKLNNKTQALHALQSSLKPESRVLKMLEKEVEWLQGEKRQLEAHLTRTEIWGENLGKWRAIVQSAEVPDEKEPPQFVIVVHMMESDTGNEEQKSSGWVVSRTLTQFQELHRKLRPLCSDVKGLELPSQTFKFLFGKSDRNSLDKAKLQIQKYLEFILEDDRLNQSEAIYSFLSPSSEHLKHTAPSTKKSKFSFSTLFKSNNDANVKELNLIRDSEEEDISQYLDAPGSSEQSDGYKMNGHSKLGIEDSKDTIAEPLYSLMSEIFDMRGLFKYLRKTLIAFVQITYGRTINRQIYDSITWCFSEKMLHYYITLMTKSFWPQGELAPKSPERGELERKVTANEARKLFVSNVPEVLVTLVGASAARNGARKVFDTLQNKKMNKQLFYELFEVFTIRAFPELNIEQRS